MVFFGLLDFKHVCDIACYQPLLALHCRILSLVHVTVAVTVKKAHIKSWTRGWIVDAIIDWYARMWANAQRDGRPAEYRWRPVFNAAKFGWHPPLEGRALTPPRRETRWNLQGCRKLPNRSQPLVGRSSPYYQDMGRRYCCLTRFFSDCRCMP